MESDNVLRVYVGPSGSGKTHFAKSQKRTIEIDKLDAIGRDGKRSQYLVRDAFWNKNEIGFLLKKAEFYDVIVEMIEIRKDKWGKPQKWIKNIKTFKYNPDDIKNFLISKGMDPNRASVISESVKGNWHQLKFAILGFPIFISGESLKRRILRIINFDDVQIESDESNTAMELLIKADRNLIIDPPPSLYLRKRYMSLWLSGIKWNEICRCL